MKVYELKRGDKILYNDDVLEFCEIRGDKAIFYNELGMEIEFPGFLYIDEIGELIKSSNKEEDYSTPSLF